jgi:hypothetical protein
MLGYPLAADPNQAFWYPVLRAARLIPYGFNAYAILPYVIAAIGMAGFARRVSGSIAGGIVAGLTFSLGGFMTSHQGHLNLIHPAAWTPYLLWAIEELRRRPNAIAAAGGAIALALCASSGPQQPLVYAGLVAVAYAVVFRPRSGQAVYWLYAGAMLVLGVGLSAISVVPAAEFVPLSSRAGQTYADYIVYSTGPFEFAIRALFPYVLGDPEGFTETSNYAGILPMMLAALALARSSQRAAVWFWLAVALWGAWMSMGGALGGARVAFHIPLYSLFRIPGRHALEFAMAIAALSAFGVATIERGSVRLRDLVIATLPIGCACIAVLVAVAPHNAAPVWALAVPVAVCAGSLAALLLWTRSSNRMLATLLGIGAVACDLLTFAVPSPHRYATVPASIATPPPDAARMRDALTAGGYRFLAPLGSARTQAIPPNLSALWHVPAVSGYVSLEDRRVGTLLQMQPDGEVFAPALPSLDLVGTRYMIFAPSTEDLNGFVGADPLTLLKTLAYAVPSPQPATAIELVSALGDSVAIPDGARVADLTITDDAGRSYAIPVLAGRDTSESAFERPDVRPLVRHREARVFSGDAQARLYVARFAVPTRRPLTRIAFHWVYGDPLHGALSIVHLATLDGARATPIRPVERFFADGHWRAHGTLGDDVVLENERALPAAWAVASVRTIGEDRAQQAAVENATFDPRAVAITADEAGYSGGATAQRVTATADEPGNRTFAVTCAQRCMLVVNQLFYPGWLASVDGAPAPIARVDYLLQGIDVGPGAHSVRVSFAPRSLFAGAAITALAAIAILVLALREWRIGGSRTTRLEEGGPPST